MLQLQALLLLLHLLAAALWVGGMVVMHFAVRPAAQATLDAPMPRLAFMAEALQRFFALVIGAIALLWLSGLWLVALRGGMAQQPWSVHLMLGLALLMTLVFVYLRFSVFVRLRRAVRALEPPVAVAALATVRVLVLLNLVLGLSVFAVALVGPAFSGG